MKYRFLTEGKDGGRAGRCGGRQERGGEMVVVVVGWREFCRRRKSPTVESESVVEPRCRWRGSFSGTLAAARAKASTLSGHLGREALSEAPPLFLLFTAATAAAAEVQKSSESRGRLGFCALCHRISKKKIFQNKM